MQEMCQEMHEIRWMFTISVTKCPLVLFVNFTIISENKYGQIKVIECPPNYANQWGKHSSAKPNLNKEPAERLTLMLNQRVAMADSWKNISEIKSR